MKSKVEIRKVKEKEKEKMSVCSGDIVLFRVGHRDKIATKALGRVNRRLSNSIEIATIGGATIHKIEDKDDIYVAEINMNSLLTKTKPIKYKKASSYPNIIKDLAFVVDKKVTSDTLMKVIKKSGGRLLTDIDIFDVYTGSNVLEDEKSIAFKLTFSDPTRTLSDEEVMTIFNKIIKDVEDNCNAKLRSI